jgi:choline dehydrogenase-like flavoprotein
MTHHKTGSKRHIRRIRDKYYYGRRPNGIYIPRFQNLDRNTKDYLRGFNYQGNASRPRTNPAGLPGFGAELKEQLSLPAGYWEMGLTSFGEQLPDHQNFVRLSLQVRDKWGLPVPEITFAWKDNEYKMSKDSIIQAKDMFEKSGLTDIKVSIGDPEPMSTVHEMGTARMGKDPKTSVLNSHNQVHAVPNVFVTDGACMTSCSSVNPSLHIWR